jgi:histidine triad (HIT) family protein
MNTDPNCIFCKILAGEIPSARVYEDEWAYAFMDIGPIRPGHTLLITKEHYELVTDLPEGVAAHLGGLMPRLGRAVVRAAKADGFNIHQTNGACSGQVVPHVHFHIIPRHDDDGYSFRWKAGSYAEGELAAWGRRVAEAME